MRKENAQRRSGGAVDVLEAHYQSLFANSAQGMARVDLDGKILEANDALVRRGGNQRAELIGHSFREYASVESLGAADELIAELQQGRTASREVRLVRRTGEQAPRLLTVVPEYSGGVLTAGFLVIQDITERIAAEQLIHSLFAHHPHGIGSVDVTGKILDVNDALIAMSGYSRDEFLGSNFMDFAGADTRDFAASILVKTLEGKSQYGEMRPYRKDGSRGHVALTTIPMRVENQIVGAFLVLEDIEHRKLANETMQRQAVLLEETEQRFRSFFSQNPNAVCDMDRQGHILDANDALLALGGYPRETIIGQDFRLFMTPEERANVEPYFARVLQGEAVNYELVYQSPVLGRRVLEVTSFPRLSHGETIGAYAIMVDATAQREAQKQAEEQSNRIRELYLVAATANIADSQITTMLETGCRLLNMEVGAIVDCAHDFQIEHRVDLDSSRTADEQESVLSLAAEVNASQHPVTLTPARHLQGRFTSAIGVPLTVAGQPYGALCFASTTSRRQTFAETDIDLAALMSALMGSALERRRSRASLRTLAYYDSLTGLPNRIFVQERLRDAIEAAQSTMRRVAVIFFDLDRFKDVNDTLGHALGDRLLQLVATRLVETVRDRGTVARTGGDEFIVLLPNCESLEEIRKTAEELLSVVDDPYHIDDYEQFVTASAGISIYPDDGKDDQTLIKNADIAMYRAKDLGRNAYQLYAPSLEATIQMRLSQEKLLRRALENEEFIVHYQPQVDMMNGRIVAFEALVRWNHPKSGIIFPGRFIPSAEMSGLIVPLGDWVLRTATAQVRIWQETFPGLRIAVNLSAKQFHQPDLRARILSAVDAAGLDPSAVEMEITESVAMTDAAASVQIMRDLVDSGIRIGLDDFGTGYSSLGYLRRFPASVLKIDRSFVSGVGTEPNDETIVITVIAMAHNLGLEVVAEGVETAEQYDFLRTYGCDRVQGYYISPAVPVSGIQELLAEWRPHQS